MELHQFKPVPSAVPTVVVTAETPTMVDNHPTVLAKLVDLAAHPTTTKPDQERPLASAKSMAMATEAPATTTTAALETSPVSVILRDSMDSVTPVTPEVSATSVTSRDFVIPVA